jgi:hypothetical protein
MEGINLSIPKRMVLLRIVLVFTLIVSIFLSGHLWGGYRTFPYAPIINGFFIDQPFDLILIGLAIISWVCSLFLKNHRLFIFCSLCIGVILVLLDINRLQPWFYTFNVLLAILIFYNGRVDDPNQFTSIFIILQLIIASVYFYCGISQLNTHFIASTYVEIISPLKLLMSARQFIFFEKIGVVVPFLFIFIALALTISPLRYLGITLSTCVHIVLLILLFPSEQNTNYAMWFGNIAMMIIVILLFSGKTKQRYFSPGFLLKMPLFYLVAILFIIMPMFNTINKWPDYLSSNFSSGNNASAIIILNNASKEKLPRHLQVYCEIKDSFFIFNYTKWCSAELQSSCYPSLKVFNSIYHYLARQKESAVKDIQLISNPKAKFLCIP